MRVSKLCGELYARAYLDDLLIVRTSGVFGLAGLKTARGNFVELMLRLAADSQPIRVVADMVASPTYAPALAHCTGELVERGARGIFHAGGGTAISWFEYAKMIFHCAGLDPEVRALPANASIVRRLGARATPRWPTPSWTRWASSRCRRSGESGAQLPLPARLAAAAGGAACCGDRVTKSATIK
jgi:dTDP-4-dehydrorhamnose reductase